jgi:CubicO group peptidase (beta-lactamase class C family)
VVAHGLLNRATRVHVTGDSLFQIGSITKIWTSTMIMQLVDEGLLSLDATIADVLPGIQIGADDIGGQVTVRHLLTHTSGLDGDIFTDTGRGDDCIELYVSELAKAPSTYAPGTAYSYCNSGFVLLGRIIEVLDGQSWDESLRERLIGPLALSQTVTLPEQAILHRAAVGHHRDGTPVRLWSLPRSFGPAGLITAAASDLLAFARLHLDGGIAPDGKRLLSEVAVSAMQGPQAPIPDFSTPGTAIGLGWRLNQWGERTVIGHDGDTVGQSAYLRIDPEARVAACLLTNSAESGPLFRELFNEVFGTLAGVGMPEVPYPATSRGPGATDIVPERYVGRYERTSRRFDVSLRDGQLHVVLTVTGHLAELTDSEPEELILYPADSSGLRFVLRSHDDEPWVPLSFGQLADGTPCIFLSSRVTPRTRFQLS